MGNPFRRPGTPLCVAHYYASKLIELGRDFKSIQTALVTPAAAQKVMKTRSSRSPCKLLHLKRGRTARNRAGNARKLTRPAPRIHACIGADCVRASARRLEVCWSCVSPVTGSSTSYSTTSSLRGSRISCASNASAIGCANMARRPTGASCSSAHWVGQDNVGGSAAVNFSSVFHHSPEGLITGTWANGSKLRLIFDETAKRRGVYLFDEFDAVGGHARPQMTWPRCVGC